VDASEPAPFSAREARLADNLGKLLDLVVLLHRLPLDQNHQHRFEFFETFLNTHDILHRENRARVSAPPFLQQLYRRNSLKGKHTALNIVGPWPRPIRNPKTSAIVIRTPAISIETVMDSPS
jgi:hypothetical protein